jgi:Ca-activated chloride channel homolog
MSRRAGVNGVVAILMCCVGFSVPAATQGPTFRTQTELVTVNVSVVGKNAQPVGGLTEEQFEVFEDGVRQNVQFFAPGEMPLDVVIVLDTSASMGSSLALVQTAAVRFIEALRPADRISVMAISGGLRILQPLTGDKDAVSTAIRQTRPSGRTPLYAAIYTALRELHKARDSYATPRRQAMVVLSDGQDTASGFGFDDLMDSVRRQAVPIYTIAPRASQAIVAQREMIFGETTREQDFELRRLAAETGARAFFPVVLQELAGVYEDIANELAHQYSLGYESSNSRLDGGFRRIGLRVAAPGVKWRTRAGYIAIADALPGADLR